MAARTPILVLTCGNRMAGDDAIGCFVADALRALRDPRLEVLDDGTDPAEFLERVTGRQTLIVVDAVIDPGRTTGEIVDLDWFAPARPAIAHERAVSSHAWSVPDQIGLAAALGMLPPTVRLIAVCIEQARLGQPMTPAVKDRVDAILRLTCHYHPSLTDVTSFDCASARIGTNSNCG